MIDRDELLKASWEEFLSEYTVARAKWKMLEPKKSHEPERKIIK